MKIWMNNVFCLHNNYGFLILESAINLALGIFNMDPYWDIPFCIYFKIKRARSHASIECLHSIIFTQKIIENSRYY